ncbi:bifunctional DNA-formamidopyrimidine glycosylase/DNA-(apurinic or apyrimidinic site) lyase [Limnoglobus roseus]|uniref:Formamidopyrimidine-DNA glycosylase n=1 Tax=Limnoglobus roseus TaxID=2598579 RepID=A0A5C1AKI5_9BACT|nr:bifunctional DNA-formamidopyrimidine glycosylase/DNA-(apurinic or apyrimidinic site) lyase [Limnoglobus roseus]QEL19731.1 bifunctional DNA-formamidopyrimidine glycosylase/DNA-(apurinic or apyrimidinic site) lyase [Limnoglobus roseus]
MPELPEVETVVRDLRPLLVGRTIRHVTVGSRKLRHAWDSAWDAALSGAKVRAIRRRGKWILVDLANGSTLLLHLGMTGQLTVHAAKDEVADHTHLRFALDRGKDELRFRDIRRFGSATLFATQAELDAFLNARLGPEPFGLDPAYFRDLLKTTRSLKALLLDQTALAGVGNIYADEACFLAGVHPGRAANTMTHGESETLRAAIETVLTNAIEGRGSTIRNYVGGSGLKGSYQNRFNVYGRTGQPCPTCGGVIQVTTLAGRSSHFCATCQPPPRRSKNSTRVAGRPTADRGRKKG